MVLSISGHTSNRTAHIYPLVIFSNKKPKNRERTPRDFNEKKTTANVFFHQGKFSRFILVFWELPVQIRPAITFPSENLLKFKFSYFSPRRTCQVSFDAHNGKSWFSNQKLIQQVSFDFNTKLSSIARHSNKKNCSDLSSSDIENQKTQKGVGDATRL